MRPLALASDDAGAWLRRHLAGVLASDGVAFVDYGRDDADPAYPAIAHDIALRVARHEHDRAVLVCGTGIGMAIVANKVPGVFAALCHDVYSAERARRSNAAQVLTLGARVIGPEAATTIVRAWLAAEFEPGRSGAKVAAIHELEGTCGSC